MKKHAAFCCIILFFMIFIVDIQSMEKCYLALLPIDILNYIAQFLPWESQEDFIKRTEHKEEVPKDYYKFFSDAKENVKILGVFSADKTKVALFELLCGTCFDPRCNDCIKPRLVIVDAQKQVGVNKILFDDHIHKNSYRAIGVSCAGTMIAVIRKEEIREISCSTESSKSYKDVLVIKKISEEKENCFDIPSNFIPCSLAFNKQHTQVIAHDYHDVMSKKYIFNLQENSSHEQCIKDEQNKLQNYFRYRGVCNILQIQ